MFTVIFAYTASIEEVELVRPSHRDWLADLNQRGLVLVGGPTRDGSGGLVVMLHSSRELLAADLAADPYIAHEVATHIVREFTATMYHPALEALEG